MAKKPIKTKSKAVVGNTKKHKSFKLTKKSALLALSGIMAFSIVAAFGQQKWDEHRMAASAYNWTTANSFSANGWGTISVRACTVSSNTARYYVTNATRYAGTVYLNGAPQYTVPANSNSSVRIIGNTGQIVFKVSGYQVSRIFNGINYGAYFVMC